MTFEVNTYSPSDVVLDVSGFQITGFNSISVERNSRNFTMVKGIRGQNSRIRDRDSSCRVIVDIIQTSAVNDILSQVLEEDLRTNSARLTLDLTDSLGSSKIQSNDCFVQGYPELVYSDGIEYRRWVLVCQSTQDFIVGGNSRLSGNIFSESVGGASTDVFTSNTTV